MQQCAPKPSKTPVPCSAFLCLQKSPPYSQKNLYFSKNMLVCPHNEHKICKLHGGVAEWSIAPVLKTGVLKGTVSSNLTSSANRKPAGISLLVLFSKPYTLFSLYLLI